MRARTYIIATGILVAVVAAPIAFATGEGNPVKGGARNPSPSATAAYTNETEIIANNGTYGTRQSNKSATGGGAIYGCRSAGVAPTSHPCLRASNLTTGQAFQFATGTGSTLAGIITVGKGGDTTKPFTTNATGVATGLNADRVDSLNSDQIAANAVATAATASANARPFVNVGVDGTKSASRGLAAAGVARTATGTYSVVFTGDLTSCSLATSVTGATPGLVTVTPTASADKTTTTVAVATFNSAGTASFDLPFDLSATC